MTADDIPAKTPETDALGVCFCDERRSGKRRWGLFLRAIAKFNFPFFGLPTTALRLCEAATKPAGLALSVGASVQQTSLQEC